MSYEDLQVQGTASNTYKYRFITMKNASNNRCIDPEVGRLLFGYEMDQLTEEHSDLFEKHLMDCDFCRAELEKMMPISAVMRENKKEIVEKLHEAGIVMKILKQSCLQNTKRNPFVNLRVLELNKLSKPCSSLSYGYPHQQLWSPLYYSW